MSTDTDPIPLLIRARELIAAGWTQGAYHEGGCYCAVGALQAAALYGREIPAYEAARRALAMQIQPLRASEAGHAVVVAWNDAEGREQSEVLALFDRAIAAGGGAS